MNSQLLEVENDHRTVLMIEDERRIRELLRDVLPDMGFHPVEARDAEEANAILDSRSVDVVILDLMLPKIDGLSFLATFREAHPKTPVVILTGHGDLDAAKKAIHYGVTEFLTKPCHLGEIEAALSRAMKQVLQEIDPLAAVPERPELPEGEESVEIPVPTTLRKAERHLIDEALRRHDGNRTAAANELGISRRTLYTRLSEPVEGEEDEDDW